MSTTTPPVDKESLAVIHALTSELPVTTEDAYNATAAIRSMASENIIARFESKLDALRTVVESNHDALRTVVESNHDAVGAQLRMVMWMIGAGIGFVVAGAAVVTLILELRS